MPHDDIFKAWRDFKAEPERLEAELLLESRKTDAIAQVTNWKKIIEPSLLSTIDPVLLQGMTDGLATLVRQVSDADPTGKNKYLPWFAKYVKNYTKRHMYEYSPRYSARAQAKVERGEKPFAEDETSSYLRGILDQADRFTRNLEQMHKYMERGLITKTIEQFEYVSDIENAVFYAEREEKRREKMEKMKEAAKESSDIVMDEDGVTMVRPMSEEASCYFGQGTQWCISATSSRNYFDQYTGEGKAFYFVNFKYLLPDDNSKQLALVYDNDSGFEPDEVFDRPDEEVGEDAVFEAARNNIVMKGILQMASVKKLRKTKEPAEFAEYINDQLDKAFGTPSRFEGAEQPLGPFWQEWFTIMGLEDQDVANIGDLGELTAELASEVQSEIFGSASLHMEDHPAGPQEEDFQKVFDEFENNFKHVDVSWDDYTGEGNYYWRGYASVDLSELEEELEDASESDLVDVVREVLDDNYVYPSEMDAYDTENVNLGFDPEYDETTGAEGFRFFLNRMSEYDANLDNISVEDLRTKFEEAGVITPSQVKQVAADLEKDAFDFNNLSVNIDEGKVIYEGEVEADVTFPGWVFDDENTQAWARTNQIIKWLMNVSGASTAIHQSVVKKLQTAMQDTLEAIEKQYVLSFIDRDEDEEYDTQAWQKKAEEIGMGIEPDQLTFSIFPNYEQIGQWGNLARKSYIKDEAGLTVAQDPPPQKLTLTYYFEIRLDVDKMSEEDIVLASRLGRYVDSPKVYSLITDYIQRAVVKAVGTVTKDNVTTLRSSTLDTGHQIYAQDLEEERMLEAHRLLNPNSGKETNEMILKAAQLIDEVINN